MQFYSVPLCYVTACDECTGPPRLMKSRGSLIHHTSSSWQLPYFCSFLCNIVWEVTRLRTPQRSPLLQITISVLLAGGTRGIPCGGRNLQKGVMALQRAGAWWGKHTAWCKTQPRSRQPPSACFTWHIYNYESRSAFRNRSMSARVVKKHTHRFAVHAGRRT